MKVRIRRGILVTLLVLLVLASVSIWAAGHWVGHATAEQLSGQLMETVRESVTLRLENDLEPASALAKLNAALLRDEVFDLTEEDQEWLLRSFEVQMEQYGVDKIFVGMPDGAFWMVQQAEDGETSRIVLPPLAERGPEWQGPGPEYQRYTTFDPRERPWYAPATVEGHWSDVYRFQSGPFGLTVSARAENPEGEVLGVVGVDVVLTELADYVAQLEVTDNSRVFLLGNDAQVVAHPSRELLLLNVGDLDADPGSEAALLKATLAASGRHGPADGRPFDVHPTGLGRHHVVLSSLNARSELPEFLLGVAVPEKDVLGPILDNRFVSLMILLVTIGLGAVCAYWITRGIARPMEQLGEQMARVQQMELDVQTKISTTYLEVETIVDAFDRMVHGLRSFGRYVPREVVRGLIASGKSAQIGGEERELSIMFTDIAGFTPDAEAASAREVFTHLGEYLETVTQTIREHRGTLDKFIGDAVMAFWNAPLDVEDHPTQCALAAVEIQRALNEVRKRWVAEGKPAYPTRIGIAYANVMVGNVGSRDRFNYTVLGDGVNLAARLEPVNKFYGTEILAEEELAKRVDPTRVVVQPLDVIAVKGREQGVRIFEVLGRPEDVTPERLEAATIYAEALEAYRAGNFPRAKTEFLEVLARLPEYEPATRLVERCERYSNDPPTAFRGIFEIHEK